MTYFSDSFLEALGAWQYGWREIQSHREILAAELKRESSHLPEEFRTVNSICYRKRFIHKGELEKLLLQNCCDEGAASWTLDLKFSQELKGLTRPGALTAAIFEHKPIPSEIIVSFPALWQSPAFRTAVQEYNERGGQFSGALLNFKDAQQEVVLHAPLRRTEIIHVSGFASDFDELCDREGIPESQRGAIYKGLIDMGEYPDEPQYIDRDACQRALNNTVEEFYRLVGEIPV